MAENDALPLEYKLNHGCAGRQADPRDFVNDALGQSKGSILSLSFEEEILNLGLRQLRPFTNNRTDL